MLVSNGVAIYLSLAAHTLRLIGSMSVLGWCNKCPRVELDTEGRLRSRGTFWSTYPVSTLFLHLMGKSHIVRYFNIDYPTSISPEHLKFTARTISAAKDAFISRYPKGRFIVISYPGDTQFSRITPLLRAYDIEFLDYSNEDFSPPSYRIHALEGHPSAAANARLAELLSRDIHLGDNVQ